MKQRVFVEIKVAGGAMWMSAQRVAAAVVGSGWRVCARAASTQAGASIDAGEPLLTLTLSLLLR